MNPELRQLLTEFDAGIARLREILDRADFVADMESAAAPSDPHAGHPTLPGIDAAEPKDPTIRSLPWGDLPEPQPAPAGKVWVNRGEFGGQSIYAGHRELRFTYGKRWHQTSFFSGPMAHIELVDAATGL